MPEWKELSSEIDDLLRLKTRPIAFRRLERADELEKMGRVSKIDRSFTFCQLPFHARVLGRTIGVTRQDGMFHRCTRLHGLNTADEKSMRSEAAALATTWFGSVEDAMRQQGDYPRVPAGEAIVIGPLARVSFEPEVVMIYGTPAQMMFVMCGLQKERYERFQFHFIGEGSCADALGQCYVTDKPALGIPCFGERAFGEVTDDELVIALPAGELERAISGIKKLSSVGLRYPIPSIGAQSEVMNILARSYSQDFLRSGS
jgi:uncharacterized protein (DUF169 family)